MADLGIAVLQAVCVPVFMVQMNATWLYQAVLAGNRRLRMGQEGRLRLV